MEFNEILHEIVGIFASVCLVFASRFLYLTITTACREIDEEVEENE